MSLLSRRHPDLPYLIGYEPMPLERATLLVVAPDEAPGLLVPMLERPLAAAAPAAGDARARSGGRDAEDPYAIVAGRAVGGRDGRRRRSDVGVARARAAGAPWPRPMDVRAAGRRRDARREGRVGDGRARRAAAAADAALRGRAVRTVRRADASTRSRRIWPELLVAHGHDRAEFTIVASGPNSASPHHEPTERDDRAGDAVVLDFGGVLDGYYSDTTRTRRRWGSPSARLARGPRGRAARAGAPRDGCRASRGRDRDRSTRPRER